MKRKIIVLLLLTVLLTGKYFLSPCPDLPRSFYSSPVSVSSSRTGDTALQTGSAWTKALVWLNCYCSVPRLTDANLSLPLRLKRYHGFATVRIPGDGGTVTLLINGGDFCDSVAVVRPSDDPYGTPRVYLTLPGLAESLSYYAYDVLTAQIEAENAGEQLYGYGDGNVLVLP